MTLATDQLDRLAIDTIRTLSIDGVQQANSGHPGAPMGAAPMAYAVWTRHLRHAPTNPHWPNRDRFVLSAGHASMLLYSLLHLTGYGVSLDDLKSFRQWGSITPGHPEYGLTPGVEATTGPLGQGLGNAVGMAIAERRLAAEFNRPGHDIVDHRTYVIASDGDMQEGVASEASSIAGHLRLGRLIVLYDDNRIQLDGPTAWAFSEDVLGRYAAYGWHTQRVEDGTDVAAISAAIDAAKADERPSIIAVRTHIGFGSPNKQDTQKAHGAPLGPDEVRLVKEAYGWDPDRTFYVPDEAGKLFRRAIDEGKDLVAEWESRLDRYAAEFPAEAAELERRLLGRLPDGWDAGLPAYEVGTEVATRNASQDTIQALAAPLPELFGGSADLSESNLTDVKANGPDHFEADHAGRNLRFGVREHGMGAIANGIAYHGGFLPYCATFLTFSDYMRGSVRLASLSGLHVTYVWTHDSVGLGEDGPTHQPVEHYAALRAIPNLWFVRPGDANEAAAAWALAVERPTIRRDARPGRARVHAPEAADAGGLAGARPRGPAARRLRAARGRGREAPADPHRDGFGAAARLRGGRAARGRRDPVARREPAVLGAVRGAGRGVSGRGAAAVGAEARLGRDRRLDGLGALGRRRGRDHRARPLRRERPGRDDLQGVRLHGRAGRRRRPAGRPRRASTADPTLGPAPARAHGSHPTHRPRRCRRRSHPGHRPGPRLSTPMRVAFAADHAGAAFKDELIRRLVVELGGDHELTDLGGDGSDPTTTTRTSPSGWARRCGTAAPTAAS